MLCVLIFRKIIQLHVCIPKWLLACPNFWTWYKWYHTTYNLLHLAFFFFTQCDVAAWIGALSISKAAEKVCAHRCGLRLAVSWQHPLWWGGTHVALTGHSSCYHLSPTVIHYVYKTHHRYVVYNWWVFFQVFWNGPHEALRTSVDKCWAAGYEYFQLY